MKSVSLKGRNIGKGPTQVFYLVGRLERAARRRIADAIAPMGMTLQQYNAMAVLDLHGTVSNADLARSSHMTPQSASQLVGTIEQKGWIERTQNPEHGRIQDIRLSASGKALLLKCNRKVDEIESRMLAGLNDQHRADLQRHLKACFDALGVSDGISD